MSDRLRLVGTAPPNEDGWAIVTGSAKYTGDLAMPRLVTGRIVRSTQAHARIVSVDASAARALPGVLDVIQAADIADLPLVSTGPVYDMPLLVRDKV